MFEFAAGRVPWSRDAILALPVSVRRGHLAWLRKHQADLAAEIDKANGG